MVEEEDFEVGRMYPPLYKIRQCSVKIATTICETAYQQKLAAVYPEPEDKNDFKCSWVWWTTRRERMLGTSGKSRQSL